MPLSSYLGYAWVNTVKDPVTGTYKVTLTQRKLGEIVSEKHYEFDLDESPSVELGVYATLHPDTYLIDTEVKDPPLICGVGGGSLTGICFAFLNCKSLTTLSASTTGADGDFLTNTMHSIDSTSAFEGCTALETVNLGDFVDNSRVDYEHIYTNMFKDCVNLTTITGIIDISKSPLSSLKDMFKNCNSLTSVTIRQNSDVTSNNNLFSENITLNGITYNYLYELMGLTSEQVTTLGLTTDEVTPSV